MMGMISVRRRSGLLSVAKPAGRDQQSGDELPSHTTFWPTLDFPPL